jgi:hypothetical protein
MANFNYFQSRIQSEVPMGELFEYDARQETFEIKTLDDLIWMNFQIDYTQPCSGMNMQIGQCEVVTEFYEEFDI